MKVTLLKDIFEHDKDGAVTGLKVSLHRGRAIPFVKGRVIEMSEASGAKYIEAGLGRESTEDESQAYDEEALQSAVEREAEQKDNQRRYQEWLATQAAEGKGE